MDIKITVTANGKETVTTLEGFKSDMVLDDIRSMSQYYAALTDNGTLTSTQKGGEYTDVSLESSMPLNSSNTVVVATKFEFANALCGSKSIFVANSKANPKPENIE